MDDRQLELRFHEDMVDVYRKAKEEAGYNASRYLQMVSDIGGLETARRLISSEAPSEGYTRLYELGRLDITVEALVWDNEEYHVLFSRSELRLVRDRLRRYGYKSAS